MTLCCPRTCSRLATAAVFLAIGIIQTIAGLILLKSKYVYLLSGPNFWTAAANIAVGSLLGVSATLWKKVNKKSKHIARRNLLAALVSSAIILNGTTVFILIVGESSTLISIKLETGHLYTSTTLASEILAYAYATSICSPVICVVVSISFLTGMCLKTKNRRKRLDLKKVLNKDCSQQMYNWVYAPRLPNSDRPDLLDTSSSDSEESSDSDTDTSGLIPIQQRSYIRNSTESYNARFQTSNSPSSLKYSTQKKQDLTVPVHTPSRTGKVYFEDDLSLNKNQTPLYYDKSCEKIIDGRRIPVFSKSEKAGKKQKISCDTSKTSFNYDSKGTPCSSIAASPHGLEVFTPRHTKRFESQLTSDFNRKITDLNQMLPTDISKYEDVPLHSPNTSMEIIDETQLGLHGKLLRTSTTDHSKMPEKVQFLENSEIFSDSEEILDKNISFSKGNTTLNSEFQTSITTDRNEDSFAGEIIPIALKNSSFHSNHISKLVPVSTPVISDGFKYVMAANKGVSTVDKIKPYSKTNKIYRSCVDHNEPNMSSFRGKAEAGEEKSKYSDLSGTSILSKSCMEPMTQSPSNPTNDSFQPSTSTCTSGYLSVAEDDSADESDSEPASKQKDAQFIHSPMHKSFGPKKPNRYSKRKLHPPSHSESLQTSFKSVVEQFMKENPHTSLLEISEVLQEHLL